MSAVVIRDLDALRERLARAISAGVDGTMLEFERFSVDYRDEMLAGADAVLSLLREVAEPTDQRETRTEWGVRLVGDRYVHHRDEERARLDVDASNVGDPEVAAIAPVVLVRREVGPWMEADS